MLRQDIVCYSEVLLELRPRHDRERVDRGLVLRTARHELRQQLGPLLEPVHKDVRRHAAVEAPDVGHGVDFGGLVQPMPRVARFVRPVYKSTCSGVFVLTRSAFTPSTRRLLDGVASTRYTV